MAYFLHKRHIKKYMKNKNKIKLNYTAVWDEIAWDTFFDDFNNLTLELQKIYIYYHLSFIYYFLLNIRHGLLKYVDICKYSNNYITMVTFTKKIFLGNVWDMFLTITFLLIRSNLYIFLKIKIVY